MTTLTFLSKINLSLRNNAIEMKYLGDSKFSLSLSFKRQWKGKLMEESLRVISSKAMTNKRFHMFLGQTAILQIGENFSLLCRYLPAAVKPTINVGRADDMSSIMFASSLNLSQFH